MNLRSTSHLFTHHAGFAGLLQRLRAAFETRRRTAPDAPVQGRGADAGNIAPPGSRSGEGSESLLPYLAESLQTRPGSLDD